MLPRVAHDDTEWVFAEVAVVGQRVLKERISQFGCSNALQAIEYTGTGVAVANEEATIARDAANTG